MYIANHYIRIGKSLYKRGDCIPEDLPEDKIKWLLEAEAIQRVIIPLKFYGHGELPTVPASEAAEAEVAEAISIDVDIDISEEDAETPDISEDEEDTDIEEEVPEVDVMSGIVPSEDTQPDKKAVVSKTGRKRTK